MSTEGARSQYKLLQQDNKGGSWGWGGVLLSRAFEEALKNRGNRAVRAEYKPWTRARGEIENGNLQPILLPLLTQKWVP